MTGLIDPSTLEGRLAARAGGALRLTGEIMEATAPRIVELRVHGVSGTPPEHMLESRHVVQVAGDEYSRFFRPTDSLGNPVPSDRGDGGSGGVPAARLLEGYHWGQFTSGSWRQGLWLLLIPFGFVNAALFMLPAAQSSWQKTWHSLAGAALRTLALGLTCTFALATSLILIDVFAYQSLLPEGGNQQASGSLLALGELASAGVVLVLFMMGRQRWDREKRKPELLAAEKKLLRGAALGQHPVANDVHVGVDDIYGLDGPRFYSGDPAAPQLAFLHLAGGVLTVSLVALLIERSAGVGGGMFVGTLVWITTVSLALITVVVVILGDPDRSSTAPGKGDNLEWFRDKVQAQIDRTHLGGAAAGVAFVILGVSSAELALDRINTGERLTAVENVADTFIVVLTGCLLALFGVTWILAQKTKAQAATVPQPFRRYTGGFAAPLVATTGVFLGVGYASAAVLASTSLPFVTDSPATPRALDRVVFTWGIAVLVLAATGLVFWGRARLLATVEPNSVTKFLYRKGGVGWKSVDAAYERAPRPTVADEAWCKRIAFAAAVARAKNHLAWWIVPFVVVGSTFSVWMVSDITADWWRGKDWFYEGLPERARGFLIALGTVSLVAAAGYLVTVGRRAIRLADQRRAVNVIWDVFSFWPRSVHPFVPPPYSQFAVMALKARVKFHLGNGTVSPPGGPAHRVLLCAHSQGSLISFAAMLWLSEEELKKVALLTYGSQLQTAFPRAFPAYVNVELIERVRGSVHRWLNLYRDTDPIAGPVFSWGHTPDDSETENLTSFRLGSVKRPLVDHVPLGAGLDGRPTGSGRRECGDDWRLLDPSPADKDLETSCLTPMMKHSHFPLSVDWRDAVSELLR